MSRNSTTCASSSYAFPQKRLHKFVRAGVLTRTRLERGRGSRGEPASMHRQKPHKRNT